MMLKRNHSILGALLAAAAVSPASANLDWIVNTSSSSLAPATNPTPAPTASDSTPSSVLSSMLSSVLSSSGSSEVEFTVIPKRTPTRAPIKKPPKNHKNRVPTKNPTRAPTLAPTQAPTQAPSQSPTKKTAKKTKKPNFGFYRSGRSGNGTGATDANPRQGLAKTTLLIDLTHSNLVQKHIEIRFDKHDRLRTVREKIHQKTGTAPHFQTLQLRCSGQILAEIDASDESYDNHKLGFFFGDDLVFGGGGSGCGGGVGLEVHCIDTNPLSGSRNGLYEDVSLVEKYRMSEEDYDQRKGTLRDWGREQKTRDETFTLAKHAKEHRERAEAMRQFKLGIFPLPYGYNNQRSSRPTAEDDGVGPSSVANMAVGDRCQVKPGDRRGTVSFLGVVPELDDREDSHWVGVTFDEPVGKNKTDGSCKSTRYFEAPVGYASFVRGRNVAVGDYPERDLNPKRTKERWQIDWI
eukprot:jgi/Psemu1/326299/estExt_fgenesh1_pg.C_3590003